MCREVAVTCWYSCRHLPGRPLTNATHRFGCHWKQNPPVHIAHGEKKHWAQRERIFYMVIWYYMIVFIIIILPLKNNGHRPGLKQCRDDWLPSGVLHNSQGSWDVWLSSSHLWLLLWHKYRNNIHLPIPRPVMGPSFGWEYDSELSLTLVDLGALFVFFIIASKNINSWGSSGQRINHVRSRNSSLWILS